MKKIIFFLTIISIVSFGFKNGSLLTANILKKNITYSNSIIKDAPLKSINSNKNFFSSTVAIGTYGFGTLCTAPGFKLDYQSDGNLVLYSTGSVARALWASGPIVPDPLYCEFSNGSIILYRGPNVASKYAYWSSNTTYCFQIPTYVLQNDGNFVKYFADCNGNGYAVATGTNGGAVSSHFGVMN